MPKTRRKVLGEVQQTCYNTDLRVIKHYSTNRIHRKLLHNENNEIQLPPKQQNSSNTQVEFLFVYCPLPEQLVYDSVSTISRPMNVDQQIVSYRQAIGDLEPLIKRRFETVKIDSIRADNHLTMLIEIKRYIMNKSHLNKLNIGLVILGHASVDLKAEFHDSTIDLMDLLESLTILYHDCKRPGFNMDILLDHCFAYCLNIDSFRGEGLNIYVTSTMEKPQTRRTYIFNDAGTEVINTRFDDLSTLISNSFNLVVYNVNN